VQEGQSRSHVRRDAEPRGGVERVRGAGGEGLVQAAAGHEGVHEAGLLLALAPRQAEAQERHDVRVAVDAQDRHLPQELGEALERGLAQPNVRAMCGGHTHSIDRACTLKRSKIIRLKPL
jgi:hypothetical protein